MIPQRPALGIHIHRVHIRHDRHRMRHTGNAVIDRIPVQLAAGTERFILQDRDPDAPGNPVIRQNMRTQFAAVRLEDQFGPLCVTAGKKSGAAQTVSAHGGAGAVVVVKIHFETV